LTPFLSAPRLDREKGHSEKSLIIPLSADELKFAEMKSSVNKNVSTSERMDCSGCFNCGNIDSVLITENVFTFGLLDRMGAIKMMLPLFFDH
jgi:hypothetical protein